MSCPEERGWQVATTPDLVLEDITFEEQPSKTYREDFQYFRIAGKADGHAAMRQAIYKILNTERYEYPIYSWNYGIQLEDLFGMPIPYVCTELERKIKEALEWDDRIDLVDTFNFDLSKRNIVSVSFTVHTIFGDIADTFDYDISTGLRASGKKPKSRYMILTGSKDNKIHAQFEIDKDGYLVMTADRTFTDYVNIVLENGVLYRESQNEYVDAIKLNINSDGIMEGSVDDV